jgi:flagellar biosynthesis protein FlhG
MHLDSTISAPLARFPLRRRAPWLASAGGEGPQRDAQPSNVIPLRAGAPANVETRVIAVTSGKGGVGKSVISANLGICFARMGRRVLLVDADLALANLDLMLGISARSTIRDVLSSTTRVEDVMVEGPSGVRLLPACSGDADLSEIDETQRLELFSAIDSLEGRFDTVVIDTGAGIGSNSTAFAAAAQQTLVVVTPDPASMADAYAMIKVLALRCRMRRVYLAVNMASGPREADQVVSRLLDMVHQFLDVSVVPLGYMYRDEAVERSVRSCQPLVSTFPKASISASMQALAGRLLEEKPLGAAWGSPRLFWKRLMGVREEESK